MGLFNKKGKQQAFEAEIKGQAIELLPEINGWSMTLLSLEKGSLKTLKDVAKVAAKHATMNAAASLVGLRVRNRTNAFAENRFLICFHEQECYLIPAGNNDNLSNVQLNIENILHFTSEDIQSISIAKGKKAHFAMCNGEDYTFKYGLGSNTIYNMGDGDTQFEVFTKNF